MKLITLIRNLTLFTLFVCVTNPGNAQKDSLIKLTSSLYEITGMGGNIACKITGNGVILVDVGSNENDGKRILELVSKLTDQPVRYIIITHYHSDHTGGLSAFPGNVTIIAHNAVIDGLNKDKESVTREITINIPQKISGLKQELTTLDPNNIKRRAAIDSALKAESANLEKFKSYKIVYPTLLYDKELTLISGIDTVKVYHSGPAHTIGDSWVYFKNDNAVHLGDMLFTNCYPYIDDRVGSSTQNWAEQLKKIASQNYAVYIPGHRQLARPADLVRFANYLEDLRKAVVAEISHGKTIEAIVKELKLPAYDDFGFKFLREQNIKAVYKELTKQ